MNHLNECVCCGRSMPPPFLNLGDQPLANSYHDGTRALPRYPLAVSECLDCTHRQLTVSVDPNEMFENYLYVSGTTSTLRGYFDDFVAKVLLHFPDKPRVLDIGCNDGSLLEAFLPYAAEVRGVDPASNLVELAQSKGLNVTQGYWGNDFAEGWDGRHDIIIAMNVVGHVADPLGFLQGCKKVLRPKGLIYVQTSQCDWIANGEFDCVYHEHISYFTEESMRQLAQRAGLRLSNVEKAPVHGRSWLFTLTDPLGTFTGEAECARDWVIHECELAWKAGHAVVGYGAAAKANTFLNYADLKLDYIIEDNPLKWGHLTPGMDIKIVPPTDLAQEERPVTLLLLAWNFEEEIVRKVKELRGNKPTTFLRYFPNQANFV